METPRPESSLSHQAAAPEGEALFAEMRRLDAEIACLKDQLARAQRLETLGTMAAAVAHEINNALTPVMAYAQLALEDETNAALTHRALQAAVDGVGRAARIADSVLGLARDDDQEVTSDAPRCPLRETAEAAAACLAPIARQDQIDIACDVPGLDVAIAPQDLHQVLVNLLGNACGALADVGGDRRVDITARRQPASPNTPTRHSVELVITDNGPGVPGAIGDRLFEAFVTHPTGEADQGDPASKAGRAGRKTSSGSGLGLSISRELIERAGGQLSYEPVPGGGAAFCIRLDIACADK